MGVIIKKIKLEGIKGSFETDALFDTGATMSFIKESLAKKLSQIIDIPNPYQFETAEANRFITVNKVVRLDFYLNGDRLSDEFLILPDEIASENVIIGAKTMQAWGLIIDIDTETVYSKRKIKKYMLK